MVKSREWKRLCYRWDTFTSAGVAGSSFKPLFDSTICKAFCSDVFYPAKSHWFHRQVKIIFWSVSPFSSANGIFFLAIKPALSLRLSLCMMNKLQIAVSSTIYTPNRCWITTSLECPCMVRQKSAGCGKGEGSWLLFRGSHAWMHTTVQWVHSEWPLDTKPYRVFRVIAKRVSNLLASGQIPNSLTFSCNTFRSDQYKVHWNAGRC